jgi:hypothetical protein
MSENVTIRNSTRKKMIKVGRVVESADEGVIFVE